MDTCDCNIAPAMRPHTTTTIGLKREFLFYFFFNYSRGLALNQLSVCHIDADVRARARGVTTRLINNRIGPRADNTIPPWCSAAAVIKARSLLFPPGDPRA